MRSVLDRYRRWAFIRKSECFTYEKLGAFLARAKHVPPSRVLRYCGEKEKIYPDKERSVGVEWLNWPLDSWTPKYLALRSSVEIMSMHSLSHEQ